MADSGFELTYEEWRAVLDRELGVTVVDDEGRRRCQQDGALQRLLTRRQAEAYYVRNSFVRSAEPAGA